MDPLGQDRAGRWGKVSEEVMSDPRLPDRAKVLYSCLATFAGEDRSCFPSRQRLADMMSRSLDTITRAIRDLVRAGWLKVVRRPGSVTRYTLLGAVAGPREKHQPRHGKRDEQPREDTPREPSTSGNAVPGEGYADEHGPLVPRCPVHAAAPTDRPCRACGEARRAYDTAVQRRAGARVAAEIARNHRELAPKHHEDLTGPSAAARAEIHAAFAAMRRRKTGATR